MKKSILVLLVVLLISTTGHAADIVVNVTFTIPDAQVSRVQTAFESDFPRPEGVGALANFQNVSKDKLIEWLKGIIHNYERGEAIKAIDTDGTVQ